MVLFLDKVMKLLELGNKPKAIIEIHTLISLLERQITKKKGKQILPIPIAAISDQDVDLQKINEIINFINNRFPIQ